jgi:tRNA-splicing ligase RtcB
MNKKPIKIWAEAIEDSALLQAENLASLPFTFHHVALMPDCHTGYGMPIGGVLATEGVVVPNAVGVDIGCGMQVIRTSIKADSLSEYYLRAIVEYIQSCIPVGFKHHTVPVKSNWHSVEVPNIPIVKQHYTEAGYQLGTLGGGNHFIELQAGDDGWLYVMLHSGSRNFGYQIAKHFNAVAQDNCKRWHSNIPTYKGDDGLAFLPVDTIEGDNYLKAMSFAMTFAKASRSWMMTQCEKCIERRVPGVVFSNLLDVHHNYVALENHFGRNVYVHRKGAIRARAGELGIIPGSQGTKSYLTEGLGNRDSFMSSSHGAGRKMSRMQARRELSLEGESEAMRGVIHNMTETEDLEEAPGAYKDISRVMDLQKDLTKIKVELTPLAVIKA